jgi:hypothetical protein
MPLFSVKKTPMNEIKKNKDQSALVKSVLSLDNYFSDLERLSSRIEEMELKSDFDLNQARQLMSRFAEAAQSVSLEIVSLAAFLDEARAKAEANGKIVAAKAEELQLRQNEQELKLSAFRALTGKVTILNENLKLLKKTDGEEFSDSERAAVNHRLADLKLQLQPLIDEANILKDQARNAKMKVLEQNADSLSQSLSAVSQKLSTFQPALQ